MEILGWTLALVHQIFVPNQRHFKFITNLACLVVLDATPLLVGEEIFFLRSFKNTMVIAKFLLLALAENPGYLAGLTMMSASVVNTTIKF